MAVDRFFLLLESLQEPFWRISSASPNQFLDQVFQEYLLNLTARWCLLIKEDDNKHLSNVTWRHVQQLLSLLFSLINHQETMRKESKDREDEDKEWGSKLLLDWIEGNFDYASSVQSENVSDIYQRLFWLARSGRLRSNHLEEVKECCLNFQQPWIVSLLQVGFAFKEENKEGNLNTIELWKSTLESTCTSNGSSNLWQRAFIGLLVGDPRPIDSLFPEDPLTRIWARLYIHRSLDVIQNDLNIVEVNYFSSLMAYVSLEIIRSTLPSSDPNEMLHCMSTILTDYLKQLFNRRKQQQPNQKVHEVGDPDLVNALTLAFWVAIFQKSFRALHWSLSLSTSLDQFWHYLLVDWWMMRSMWVNVQDTLNKLPLVGFFTVNHQPEVLSLILYEETLTLPDDDIKLVLNTCHSKFHAKSIINPTIQLLLQRILTVPEVTDPSLDPEGQEERWLLLEKSLRFVRYPLLNSDSFTLELVCALSRKYFLAVGKPCLDRGIKLLIPLDLRTLSGDDPLARELASYGHFYKTWEAFMALTEHLERAPIPPTSNDESSIGACAWSLYNRQHQHWIRVRGELKDAVLEELRATLQPTGDWLDLSSLSFHSSSDCSPLLLTTSTQREEELRRIKPIGMSLLKSIDRQIIEIKE